LRRLVRLFFDAEIARRRWRRRNLGARPCGQRYFTFAATSLSKGDVEQPAASTWFSASFAGGSKDKLKEFQRDALTIWGPLLAPPVVGSLNQLGRLNSEGDPLPIHVQSE